MHPSLGHIRAMHDLYQGEPRPASSPADYTADDIEVLEGLEPVRRRPGMYIGGTDERALHHLVAEVLDNAMDEAVAGHASRIELELEADGAVTVRDNGRGIPVDPHPKFPDKSALEVILTTLHSGGKFGGKAYQTSGGLHGVGVSVVNALSERAGRRGRARPPALAPALSRGGQPATELERSAAPAEPARHHGPLPRPTRRSSAQRAASGRRCSTAWRAPRPICSAASRSAGAATRRCSPARRRAAEARLSTSPAASAISSGAASTAASCVTPTAVRRRGRAPAASGGGRVEWAIAWPERRGDGFCHSYCNTDPDARGRHPRGRRCATR